jgi:hypothetical protein
MQGIQIPLSREAGSRPVILHQTANFAHSLLEKGFPSCDTAFPNDTVRSITA